MVFFEIGCNFDPRLVDGVAGLNGLSRHSRIAAFYGSDRGHAFLAARPNFRLPAIGDKALARYVRRCRDAGIAFNYTLNTMYPGTKRVLVSRKREILDRVRFVEDIGVRTVTVSHPLLAEFVREVSASIGIEVSTISHLDTVTQVKIWKNQYGITSVCGNLLKNRSIDFLKREAAYCRKRRIALVLMVNEFCISAGGAGKRAYGSHCIYRDSCYLCHAGNKTKADDQLFDRYPMGRCITSRRTASAWLKAMFIRPEDIVKYHRLGVSWFKITGRTGSTEYILSVAESYLKRSWPGNLLGLWKPLETIISEQPESEFKYPVVLNNKALDGFVDFWFQHRDHDCSNEVCGETCAYCNEYAGRLCGPNMRRA